jgi:Putative Ig domain
MTALTWRFAPGFLGTLTERQFSSVSVEAQPAGNITYSLLSGSLPPGMNLNSSTGIINGTPLSVPDDVDSTFVIRAVNTSSGIIDGTFSIEVQGPSQPIWATSSGSLPAGLNGEYYTFNKEFVDYTVRAQTDVLTNGNTLKYFIGDNDGGLPPGLTLTQSGRIYGFVNDLLTLDYGASATGGYDSENYDGYPYDHAIYNSQGVLQQVKPTSIDKIYQFYITVTDGIATSKRLFSIKVIDPNSLRVDNTFIKSDETDFDTSVGYLLSPLWQDNLGNKLAGVSNLGSIRAGKEQVFSLYEYDPYPLTGPVTYSWDIAVNPEISLVTDNRINNAGIDSENIPGKTAIYFKNATVFPIAGMKIRFSDYIGAAGTTVYTITGVVQLGSTEGYLNIDQPLADHLPDSTVFYVGTPSVHPPGLTLDGSTGKLYGRIQYQPAFSKTYRFTIKTIKTDINTGGVATNSQIFSMTVLGDIQSSIQFITTGSLGTLIPGEISELAAVATNTNSTFPLEYSLVSGQLPAGLTLNSDGSIQGQIAFDSQTHIDLLSSDGAPYGYGAFTLDGGTTTIDENWYFTVQANDVYKLDAVTQQVYIKVLEDNLNLYTRIYIKPFLSIDKRTAYKNFTTDKTVFDPALLYRPNDPNFGVQSSIKLVIESGIQQATVDQYFGALQNFLSRKRFYFGDVGYITATDIYGKSYYDIVYVSIVDSQMSGSVSVSPTTYSYNGQSYTTYPESIGYLQTQLESIDVVSGTTILVDDRLQPKYQTTLDQSTGVPIGFIKVVPLCYTLPGQSAKIISRINNLITTGQFSFQQFDFDTDRIVVETLGTGTNWVNFPLINT